MRDSETFEDRFTAVVGRYLEAAPTDVDPIALAREMATRPRRRSLIRGAGRPLRLALVLGLLVALLIAAAALVGALPSPRTYSGVFTPTGSMVVARSGHHATLLRDGRVLITGGEDDQHEPIAAAELYDPATGTFSEAGQLTKTTADCCGTGFGSYAITALADGRALVVGGGSGAQNPLASAELYDPRTGTFTPTGPIPEPLRNPTATLLLDGRVLVAGGAGGVGSASVMTAELYDPATGTFTDTGQTGEHVDTATSLIDGRVLVTGNNRLGRRTAELYDPKSGTFTPTGSPTVTDTASAMLLRDGRVLFSSVDPISENQVSAEVYDPATGTFASTGPLTETRQNPTTTLLQDGRVLILGGGYVLNSAGNDGPLASAELYDPQTGTLTPTASLNEPRWGATATLLMDGRVLVAGGAGQDNGLLDSAELYR